MTIVTEISSFPKSGNTWVRQLLARTFSARMTEIPDIHEKGEDTRGLMKEFSVNNLGIAFYKSHIVNNSQIVPDKVIYIYRHPLDVFISALNYFSFIGRTDCFLNKKIKSVEEIVDDGEMSFYFDRFSDDLGERFWPQYGSYRVHVEQALLLDHCSAVRYEDLLIGRENTLATLIDRLLPGCIIEFPEALFEKVDRVTIQSDNQFYWKGKAGNYRTYLSEDEIDSFSRRHGHWLKNVGY